MEGSNEYSSSRVPPQAIEVEQAVLGACLSSPEALEVIMAELGHAPDIFFKPAHQMIFEVVSEEYRKGSDEQVDIVSIEDHLRDRNKLAPVGGSGYLVELTRQISVTPERHCKILLEKYTKRQLILDSMNTVNMAYDPEASPFDLLDKAMSSTDAVANILYNKQGKFVGDMLQSVLEDIERRRENPGLSGVPSGTPLDKYTGGFQPGNLYIIAARPSIGKTAFVGKAAFTAALSAADRYRANVFWSNLEMTNEDLIKRELSRQAKVNSTKIRDGKTSDPEMKRLISAAEYLYSGRIILDDTPGIGINEWRAKYKVAVRRENIQLGIVDYLQLMSGKSEGNREQEISSISRGLKAAAMETKTPIVALSQLSRECLKRPGCEPFLADLRESGSLEQDADGVIMLNRPEFFGHAEFKGRPTKGKGIVKVEKMRNGMTGEFWMNFEKQFADWQSEAGDDLSDNPADHVPAARAPIPQSLFDEDEEYQDESPF